MTDTKTNWCERLPWDSEFFGAEIGRIRSKGLSSSVLETANRWCEANAIDCLYFLGEAGDTLSIRCAEQAEFELVDIRMTLGRRIGKADEVVRLPEDAMIRSPIPSDLGPLRAIARNSYSGSRFYVDGRFVKDKCDRMYEIWLENSFSDPAGAVLVAEWQGNPSGYVTCSRFDGTTGQIGLIASSAQGAGLGKALVNSALNWFRREGLNRARVVTQGRNIRAQVLYQKCGFYTQSVDLWYHKWFDKSSKMETYHCG